MPSGALRALTLCVAGGACRRSAGFVAFAGVLLGFPVAAAAAQVRTSAVVGGVNVHYGDAIEVNALTLSPTVTARLQRFLLSASGTYSRPSGGDWSAQGALSGSWFRPVGGPFAAELGASSGVARAAASPGTGRSDLFARLHTVNAFGGAWAGAGLGSSDDGVAHRTARTGELGAWAQWNALTAVVSWTPVSVAGDVEYQDLEFVAQWRGRRTEVDATLGHRSGLRSLDSLSSPAGWMNLNASWRIADRVALVGAAGSYPRDPQQGFPSGRFVSFGVRLTGPGTGAAPEFARTEEESAREQLARGAMSALSVRRRDDGYEIRVRASGARTMELTGDLTGWDPVAMRAEPDGWWSIVVTAEPGTYEVSIRRDGGAWLVPPGLVEHRDEFGGRAGVLALRR